MDLGRMDMLLRSGIFRAMRARGWYGVVASETIRFRQSLQLWQRFELHTDTLGWDERSIYLRQTFVRNDAVIAIAIVRARFLARSGEALTAADVANAVAPGVQSPPLPDYVREWQRAEHEYSTLQ
jgi:acyl-CoA thioesterase FadM